MQIICNADKKYWDKIIGSFKESDVYQLSGYVNSLELHGDGEPVMFFYEKNGLRAVNISMKRDISEDAIFKGKINKGEYFDLSTPYGYGGFILEGDISDEKVSDLKNEYMGLCSDNNIISEFVRFNPLNKSVKEMYDFYNAENIGKTISIDLRDIESMWANFDSKNRNKIRKAIKNGVTVNNGKESHLIEKFKEIYYERMDLLDADDYYYFKEDFFKNIFESLGENVDIFYAEYDGKIIAMSVVLLYGERLHYHLSAGLFGYRNTAAVNLILYEIAKWGNENGYTTLHLGGGLGSKEDSLYRFKKGFNRSRDEEYYIGKKILDQEKYSFLSSLNEEVDSETEWFPKYRKR